MIKGCRKKEPISEMIVQGVKSYDDLVDIFCIKVEIKNGYGLYLMDYSL